MEYSKNFIRFNWLSLILIYLVIIAGSLLELQGGMGCPDYSNVLANGFLQLVQMNY